MSSSRDGRADGIEVMRLRAHHLCCLRFGRLAFEERGAEFRRVADKIRGVLNSSSDSLVIVVEGTDELCQACPDCVEGRCNSPLGDEVEVRKWDAILLKELGLSYGICLTSRQWQALIEPKVPFKLCQRCQWREVCRIGAGRR